MEESKEKAEKAKGNNLMKATEWLYWNIRCNWNRYFGKKDITLEENYMNDDALCCFVKENLENGTPFMAGKLGGSEAFAMWTEEFGFRKKGKKACEQLSLWSGFFPRSVELMGSFTGIMKNAVENTDVLLRWYQPYEEYFIEKYAFHLKGVCDSLGAWASANPWSAALKGKKVLVIHPFATSIKAQYLQREKLFQNANILPEFDLKVLKAIQTIGDEKDERFVDWFAALQYMCEEAMKVEFDIALIGCGAYGFPLASYIKEHGKSAIHMGGELQILFGIMGKRWEDNPVVSQIRNEYWIYPSEQERPKGFSKVEDGCYW